jgi:hypothetical protein
MSLHLPSSRFAAQLSSQLVAYHDVMQRSAGLLLSVPLVMVALLREQPHSRLMAA